MAVTYDPAKLKDVLDAQGRRNLWLVQAMSLYGYVVSESFASRVIEGKQPMPKRFAECAALAVGIPIRLLTTDELVAAND